MITELKTRLDVMLKTAIALHVAGRGMSSATKGSEREIFVQTILERVFPNGYRFSGGDIFDRHGKSSGQVDIVLEFPHEPTFPTFLVDKRLLLAESVIAAIEVKSNLNSVWKKVIEKARSVHALEREVNWVAGSFPDDELSIDHLDLEKRVPFLVVAFDGPATKTIQRRLASLPANDRPDAVFILKTGAFVFNSHVTTNEAGLLTFLALLSRMATVFASAHSALFEYV